MYQRDEKVLQGLTKQIWFPCGNLHSRPQTGSEGDESEVALVSHYITLRRSRPTRVGIQVSKLQRWVSVSVASTLSMLTSQ